MTPTTYLKIESEEVCHELWSTPVILAKPFSKEFHERLKQDIIPILQGPGQYNHNDLWNLSEEWTSRGYKIPETMLAVKEKFLELADKYFRPHSNNHYRRFVRVKDILDTHLVIQNIKYHHTNMQPHMASVYIMLMLQKKLLVIW